MTGQKPFTHGTTTGARTHRRRGEPLCDECRFADMVDKTIRRAKQRERAMARRLKADPWIDNLKAQAEQQLAKIDRDPHHPQPWQAGALCAGLGGKTWNALPEPTQTAVCAQCPVIDDCRRHARAIKATGGLVFAGATWLDGRPDHGIRVGQRGCPRKE